MTDDRFYDDLETRSGDQRETVQFAELRSQLAMAREKAPYFTSILADHDLDGIVDRAALAALPVTRKADLLKLQADTPPFGGLATQDAGAFARLFLSPGPIYEPQGTGHDWFRVARTLYAAGFRKGDIVHNCFAYHLTPGGFLLDSGARALGCAVIPAGVGNTEMQLQVLAQYKPCAYTGTPDYLKILLDKADEAGVDTSFLTKAGVGGAALPESLRSELEARGVHTRQSYATADLGVIAYETEALEGMVVNEGAIVEIVRPGTGEPVAEGEVGEVVVTILNKDYPLLRFATGDMSAVLAGNCPTGRTNMRIKGWMGRADQRTKVKGMFIDPAQIAEVIKRHPEIKKARLMVMRDGEADAMILAVEAENADAGAIEASLQDICKVRGTVTIVTPGSLPNDGKIISDERDYG